MWWSILAAFAADADISGDWVLAEEPAALAAKHSQALEDAVAQLPWAFRAIARRKLAEPIKNCTEVMLNLDAAALRARCDQDNVFERPRDKDAMSVTGKDGKPYAVGLVVKPDWVELSFEGEEGGQRTRYAVTDGELVLTKQILSDWFESPVKWSVRYRRK